MGQCGGSRARVPFIRPCWSIIVYLDFEELVRFLSWTQGNWFFTPVRIVYAVHNIYIGSCVSPLEPHFRVTVYRKLFPRRHVHTPSITTNAAQLSKAKLYTNFIHSLYEKASQLSSTTLLPPNFHSDHNHGWDGLCWTRCHWTYVYAPFQSSGAAAKLWEHLNSPGYDSAGEW